MILFPCAVENNVNMLRPLCKQSVIGADCNVSFSFLTDLHKSPEFQTSRESLRPVGATLIHVDGRTVVAKLVGAFCSHVNVPNNEDEFQNTVPAILGSRKIISRSRKG
jgi:hypothetical protein